MKLNLKMSMLAGVLALAAAGQASASIATDVAGTNFANDQLILSVWDPLAKTSYTRGLDLTIGSFISAADLKGSGFTATGGGVNYPLAADANLASFLSSYAADGLLWNVVAGSVPGTMTYGTTGYVTTSNSIGTVSDSSMQNMNGYFGNYIPTVNAAMPAGSTLGNTDSVITTAPTSLANANNNFGNNFGGAAPFSNAVALGTSQDFFLLTPTIGSRGYNGPALNYQFNDLVTLGSNGTLTIAAVPEPGEWLLMLSGFGLIGFIATRRKGQGASMAFA